MNLNYNLRKTTISVLFVAIITSYSCSPFSRSTKSLGRPISQSLLAEEQGRYQGDDSTIPDWSLAYFNYLRGELALQDERYDAAKEFFEKASGFEDTPAVPLRKRLAQLHIRDGNLDLALSELDQAMADSEGSSDELRHLRAGILATQKKTDLAIDAYKDLLKDDPDNEEIYIMLTSLYAQEERYSEAKAVMGELKKKHPNSVLGWYYYARIVEAEGDYQEAENAYRKAAVIGNDAEGIRLDLARLLGSQKRFAEAVQICEEILQKNPRSVQARRLLGQLHLGDNQIDKALVELEKLETQEDDPTETRYRIALIKLEKQDFEGASDELNLVLAKRPEHWAARYYLASAYLGLKRIGDAISELEKIPSDHKLFVESRLLAGYLYQQEKRFQDGINSLDSALKQVGPNSKLLSLKVLLQRENGDVRGAIETTEKIVTLDGVNDRHYFTLGVLYDEVKDKEKAMLAMRKAIELNPDNANALNYLGYSLAETGRDLPEAEELVKRALVLESENGYFIDSLGWVYYKMGRLEEALRELKRAVEITKTDAVILEHLAIVMIDLGKVVEAREILKSALVHAPQSEEEGIEERLRNLLERVGNN